MGALLRVIHAALAIPFALGVAAYFYILFGTLSESDQAVSYYLVNALIAIVPVLVYVAAAVLLVSGSLRATAWTALLVIGLALSAVTVFYRLTAGQVGELLYLPPYLVAVSIASLIIGSHTRKLAVR